jgi:1-phosphofructokinase family hexose kinase
MILTVTLNPLLERRLTYKQINFGTVNRNAKEELKPGGKGINVSSQLNRLNTQNLAFTFLGGENGKILRRLLTQTGINFTAIQTNSETRYAAITIDESLKSVTTFFSPDSEIGKSECDEFKLKLEKMIMNCEIVVFSGSSPSEATDSVFPFGIELANKFDKVSVCDTYGKHLKDCIEKSPTIIHNNIPEVEKSLSLSLKSEKEKLDYLDYLYSKNIKQAFLTDGADITYASNFDFHYKIKNPEIETIDSTGSGDSFVAGIIYSWHNNLTFEQSLSLASALGALNAASFDVCNVTLEEAHKIAGSIKITSVGKTCLPAGRDKED